MTRLGKKPERRGISPRKHKAPSKKTGPLKDNLPKGFKEHANGVQETTQVFIPKIK